MKPQILAADSVVETAPAIRPEPAKPAPVKVTLGGYSPTFRATLGGYSPAFRATLGGYSPAFRATLGGYGPAFR